MDRPFHRCTFSMVSDTDVVEESAVNSAAIEFPSKIVYFTVSCPVVPVRKITIFIVAEPAE